MREIFFSVLMLTLPAIVLSFFFKVPYVVTILGVLAWASIGHIVDDDERSACGNSERSAEMWLQSDFALALKIFLFVGGLVAIMAHPTLLNMGA